MREDDRAYRAERRKAYRAMREEIPEVTPERAAYLRERYPVDGSDTPEGYEKIKPEEFFDGAL